MKQWYKVIIAMAHQGSGKYRDTTNYIYANNVAEVLDKYHNMRGIKRRFTPTIEQLSLEEGTELEKKIIANQVNLQRAKKTWYYGRRRQFITYSL